MHGEGKCSQHREREQDADEEFRVLEDRMRAWWVHDEGGGRAVRAEIR